MQRNWKISSLSVDLHNKRADISMTDGSAVVHASFPYDAKGDAPESAVREGAIKKALKTWGDAEKADVQ